MRRETLETTVRSALAQEFDDFEVVISDDGSTDSTLALARSLAALDSRVRVVTAENRRLRGGTQPRV